MVVATPLEGEVGDTPGAALTKSNMLARRVGIATTIFGAEPGAEAGVSRFDARARALDHHRCLEARKLQRGRSLDRRAGRDHDVRVMI